MTYVFGIARDPETGAPLAGCEVTATVVPRGVVLAPLTGSTDRFVTGVDGRWVLNLPPTAGSGAAMRIREWLVRFLYVDVPATGGTTSATAIDSATIVVAPPDGSPAPSASLYLTRAERGTANGVASLDIAGKIPSAQLPLAGAGEQLLVARLASTALSGHRVVTLTDVNTMIYATNTDPNLVNAPLWLTLGAIAGGATDSVVAYGPVVEPTWTWTPGPVYLATSGLLTQTPPISPARFISQVGYATSPTRMVFDPRPSIVLI